MIAPRRILAEPALPKTNTAFVCAIPGKGRGVRAGRALIPGDVVEVAPTIELSVPEAVEMEATPVGPYYLEHPLDTAAGMVVLGLISIVNHADNPNTVVEWRKSDDAGWFAILRALSPIAAGEEITHRYQCPPWFDIVD